MSDKPLASIIFLIDGYAPFTQEMLAFGILVMWLLNNKELTYLGAKLRELQFEKMRFVVKFLEFDKF